MSKKQVQLHQQFIRDLNEARSQSSASKQSTQLDLVSRKALELGLPILSECLDTESKLLVLTTSAVPSLEQKIQKLGTTHKTASIVSDYFTIVLNQYRTGKLDVDLIERIITASESTLQAATMDVLNGQVLSPQKDLHTQLPYLFIYYKCLSWKACLDSSTTTTSTVEHLIDVLQQNRLFIQNLDSYNNYTIQHVVCEHVRRLKMENRLDECVRVMMKMLLSSLSSIIQPAIKLDLLQLLGSTLFASNGRVHALVMEQDKSSESMMMLDGNGNHNLECEKPIEEALLVLLTCEHLLNDLTTNQNTGSYLPLSSSEAMSEIANVYDHLACVLTSPQCNNYDVGADVLKQVMERGVAIFSESDHFWFQYAVLLSKTRLHHRAFKIVETVCLPLDPNNAKYTVFVCTMGLRLGCDKIAKSIHLAQQALSQLNGGGGGNGGNGGQKGGMNHMFRAKLYHLLGLLYYKQSAHVSTMTEKNRLLELSLKALVDQVYERYDPLDYKLCYHIALVYAELRDVRQAFTFVKRSIALHPDGKEQWILLALLFSCDRQQHVQTFRTIKMILEQHPNDIRLKLLYARMEELLESSNNFNISSVPSSDEDVPSSSHVVGSGAAMSGNSNGMMNGGGMNGGGMNAMSSRSVRTYSKLSDELDRYMETLTTPPQVTLLNSNSPRTGEIKRGGSGQTTMVSIGEYRQERIRMINHYIFIAEAMRRKKLLDDATFNMSKAKELVIQLVEEIEEIESSKVSAILPSNTSITSTTKKKTGENQIVVETVQRTSRDYMTIIDLLLNNGRLQKDESQQELIVELKKTNSLIHCCQGRILEDSGKIKEAITEYEAALINDSDSEIASLRLGIIYYKHEKQMVLSRNHLQNAVRINPSNYLSWYHLGKVLSEQFGDEEEASECFLTSLNYEKTAPVIEFSNSEFLGLLI